MRTVEEESGGDEAPGYRGKVEQNMKPTASLGCRDVLLMKGKQGCTCNVWKTIVFLKGGVGVVSAAEVLLSTAGMGRRMPSKLEVSALKGLKQI